LKLVQAEARSIYELLYTIPLLSSWWRHFLASEDLCSLRPHEHCRQSCTGPPACKKRRPSGWHRGGSHQKL